jgi:hypothetical protein
MALTHLLAQAAPGGRSWIDVTELLGPGLLLIGTLLFAALVIYLVDRWRKRAAARAAASSGDQLSQFRSLYEQGEMSREEFESVRALLTGQLRREMNVPPPAATTPAAAHQPEAPAKDTNVQEKPPGPQSPPPPEETRP